MPVGGDGFYYFSVSFLVNLSEHAIFDIQINRRTICTAYSDVAVYTDNISCSAATYTAEGKMIDIQC